MKKQTLVIIAVSLIVLFPFLLITGNTVIQSFPDFFIAVNHDTLQTYQSWTNSNFGSNNSAQIWREFPLGLFYYLVTQKLNLNPGITQAFFLGALFLVCYVVLVKFLRLLLNTQPKNEWALHLAALFYLFNTYSLIQLTNSFLLVIPYLALPLQLLLFTKGLETHSYKKFAILLAITSAAVFGVNLIYEIIAFGLMCAYGLWRVFVEKRSSISQLLKLLAFTFAITLLLCLFWLLPQIYSSVIDTGTTQYVLASENFYNNDSSVTKVLRGLGDWAFFGSNNGIPYNSFSPTYSKNWILVFSGYFITAVGLAVIVLRKDIDRQRFKLILFFLLLLIVILPFIGGTHPSWPSAELMQRFFESIPYANIFRNTFKFMSLVTLSITILAATLLIIVQEKKKKIWAPIIGTLFISAVIVNAFPFFKGEIFSKESQIESVPTYWNETAEYVNRALAKNSSILTLPNQYFEVLEWPDGLKSFPRNLETTLFDRPVIHNVCKGCGSPDTSNIITYIYGNLSDVRTYKLMGVLGVSHLLQRNDYAADYYKVETPDTIKSYLTNNPYVEKLKKFGKLDLYQITKQNVYPLFYSPTRIIETGKVSEFNDIVGEFNDSVGRLSITINEQVKNTQSISQITSLYKRLFDLDETRLSAGAATNTLHINRSGKYSFQAGTNKLASSVNYRMTYANNGGNFKLNFQPITTIFSVNGKTIQQQTGSAIEQDLGAFNSNIAIEVNDKAYRLELNKSGELGYLKLDTNSTKVNIYPITQQTGENLLPNSSFENTLWQSRVLNCQQRSGDADLKMQQVNDASDGTKSLQLSSKQDTACTYSPALDKFRPGIYLYSFDTKNVKGHIPSYCVWDGKGCVTSGDVSNSKNSKWQTFTGITKLNDSASNFFLYLYSQRSNYPETVNRYDNIRVSRLTNPTSVVDINLPPNTSTPVSIDLTAGDHVFSAKTAVNPINLIDNGSFEGGLWSPEVGNCSGENDSTIAMTQVNDARDGSRGLELRSNGDTACTASDSLADFDRNSLYLLSFEYRVLAGKEARVCIWDGTNCILDKTYTEIDKDWHTAREIIKPQLTSRFLSVYFYAAEKKSAAAKVRYDNVKVNTIENNFIDTYTLTSAEKLLKPIAVTGFSQVNPTQYNVSIRPKNAGAVIFEQTYHPGWKAYVLPKGVNAGDLKTVLGFKNKYVLNTDDHFIANGFMNGWWIDPGQVPDEYKQSDGSYNLAVIYTPQKFVYYGMVVSSATLVVCTSYLVYYVIKKQRDKKKIFIGKENKPLKSNIKH